jgi:hypothetical protein
MAKQIEKSRRFLVGWGRQGERMVFFIAHNELPETKSDPIICNPEDLSQKMVELAERIDRTRGKIK